METPKTFADLNLSEFIQRAIDEMKFENPSAIQSEAIPHILAGTDIIAQAPTGSGKTAAFAIPILQKLDFDTENKSVQALVLCPTRELTIQVHKEFEKLSLFQDNVSVVSVYGGQQIGRQLSALERKPQVVVATPGRLMDHIKRGSIKLNNIKMVVLDEADEMLDMGFRDDINTILDETSLERQTVLFSATMAKDIIALTKRYQKTPIIVDVTDNLQSAPDIEQFYFEVVEKDKPELITRLLDLHNVKLALIFCNTKSNVDRLVEILKTRGYFSDSLHGDMNQAQREKVMRGFRNGSVEVLVATDVAGRGIDVKNVEAVFNYDLPRDDEDYIHRIGRTARAGESGVAFTFVSKRQVPALKRIERANGILINKKERPTVEQLDEMRLENYAKELKSTIETKDLTKYGEQILSMIDEKITVLDIASALLKLVIAKERQKINTKAVFEEDTSEAENRRGRNSRFGGGSRGNSRGNSRGGNSRSGFGGGNKSFGDRKPREFGDRKPDFAPRETFGERADTLPTRVERVREEKKITIDEMTNAVKSFEARTKKDGGWGNKAGNAKKSYNKKQSSFKFSKDKRAKKP